MKVGLFKKDTFRASPWVLSFAMVTTTAWADSETLYESATLMFNNQEYGLAKDDYQNIVSSKGSAEIDAKAAFYLGECFFQLKEHDAAKRQFRDYLIRFPDHRLRSRAQYRFAETLYLQKDFATAAKAYLRFVKDNSKDELVPHALYAAAGALMEIGDSAQAEDVLNRLAKDHPAHQQVEDAKYFIAWARFKAKDYPKAAALFVDFAERYPRSPKALEALLRAADAYYSQGVYDRSLSYYNRVLADGVGQFKKECHVGIAWSYYKSKQFEKAGNNFLILARSEKASESRSEYYYQCLRSYYDGERYEMGFRLGSEILKALDGQASIGDIHYWLGLFSLKMERRAAAIEYLSQAVKAKGVRVAKATILLELGNLYQKESQLEKAVEVYRSALSMVKNDHELESQIRYEASRSLHQLGRNDEAKAMVSENLSSKGADASVSALSEFSMGEFKYSESDYEGALRHYQAAAKGSKDLGVAEDARYREAWCLRYLDRSDAALTAFAELEKLSEKYRQEARYLMAEMYRERGDLKSASMWYEKVSEVKGQYGSHAMLSKAQMQFEEGELEACRKTLNAMFIQYPGSDMEWEGRLLLAELSYELEDFTQAMRNYDLVLERGQAELKESALYGRAWLKFESQKYDGSLVDLDRLLKDFPETTFRSSALQLKGQIYMQTDRLEQASEIFRMGLGGSEAGESALLNLASVEAELKNYEKALEVYNQVLSRYPDSEVQGRVMYEKGWLYMQMERPNEALLMFKAYRKAYPNGDLVDDVNFALGQLAYDRGAFAEATQAYEASVRSDRYKDKSLYKLAFCYLKLEKYRLAAEAFSQLSQSAPQSSLALESMYREGQSWLKAQQFDRAEKALKSYVEVGRGDVFYGDACFDLGVVFEKSAKPKEALHHYEKFIKLKGEGERVTEARVYAAKLYHQEKSYAQARDVLKLALKDKTHFLALEAQFLEGEVYFAEARYEEAIRSFLKTQLYKDGELWQSKGMLMIGFCHRELKRFDRARHYLNKVLENYANTDAAKKAVEALRVLGKS